MTQTRKYRPAIRGRGARAVMWFGFQITRGNAAGSIMFFVSILFIIGSLIGLIALTISLIQILSIYSAMQQQTGEYGAQPFVQTYGITSIILLFIWMLVLFIILIISIYTFSKMKQLRD